MRSRSTVEVMLSLHRKDAYISRCKTPNASGMNVLWSLGVRHVPGSIAITTASK